MLGLVVSRLLGRTNGSASRLTFNGCNLINSAISNRDYTKIISPPITYIAGAKYQCNCEMIALSKISERPLPAQLVLPSSCLRQPTSSVGEEMTRYCMDLILTQCVNPFVDTSKWEYYDCSCKNRDATDDQVDHRLCG
jgi:hypothetical protein